MFVSSNLLRFHQWQTHWTEHGTIWTFPTFSLGWTIFITLPVVSSGWWWMNPSTSPQEGHRKSIVLGWTALSSSVFRPAGACLHVFNVVKHLESYHPRERFMDNYIYTVYTWYEHLYMYHIYIYVIKCTYLHNIYIFMNTKKSIWRGKESCISAASWKFLGSLNSDTCLKGVGMIVYVQV